MMIHLLSLRIQNHPLSSFWFGNFGISMGRHLLTKLTVHPGHDQVLSGAHRLTDHLLHKPCSDHHHHHHHLDHHLDHLQIIFCTTSLVLFHWSQIPWQTDLKALVLVELVDLVEHFVQRADDARLRAGQSVTVVLQPADG